MLLKQKKLSKMLFWDFSLTFYQASGMGFYGPNPPPPGHSRSAVVKANSIEALRFPLHFSVVVPATPGTAW